MLISIAMALTAGAVTLFFLAWLGNHWNKTKSESWLMTMSSTEGYTDVALTASKIYRDIIRRPQGHLLWGIGLSLLAMIAWVSVILQKVG